MTRSSLVALLVLLPVGACHAAARSATQVPSAAASALETFELVGTVRDEATGRPLAGVLIVVDSLSTLRTVSGADGTYRVPAIPRGSYFVSAHKLGYYVERREVGASCSVVIVDSAGRPISSGGPCDPDRQVLNFSMRSLVLR